MKKYVLIAGVNGAGKSTLYALLPSLKEMPRVNTDEIVKEFGDWKNPNDLIKAGKIAVEQINKYFDQGISFNQETTLCGNSILKYIDLAKSRGYLIELHYVGVSSVDIAKARVSHRVKTGGHGIPEKDIERRYIETLENLRVVIPKCDLISIYDNTVKFKRFAIYMHGKCVRISQNSPDWFNPIKHEITSNHQRNPHVQPRKI